MANYMLIQLRETAVDEIKKQLKFAKSFGSHRAGVHEAIQVIGMTRLARLLGLITGDEFNGFMADVDKMNKENER